MKKILKKISMIFVTLLLMLQVYVLPVYAVDGAVYFTDPETEAGEKVDISVRVFSQTSGFGTINLKMKYDPELLKFEGGTNTVGENGSIEMKADFDSSTSDATFILTFTTLKEGTAKIEVSDYTVTNSEGSNIELEVGDSTVKIGEGSSKEDETPNEENANETEKGAPVLTIEGEEYSVNSSFSEKEIPDGFAIVDVELKEKKVKALFNETSGVYLYSLKNKSGETNYFVSDKAGDDLKKTVIVDVSTDKYIMIINPEKDRKLPQKYQSTTMTLDNVEFSIWNNMENQDYYLIYALNSEGKPGYYQYDAIESTYQRCMDNLDIENEKSGSGALAKATQFMAKHILETVCVAAALLLIFLIIIIVLGVKLSKRNSAKENFYSEDEPEELNERKTNRKKKQDRRKEKEEPVYEEDELSDYDIEFDDYYDEEEFYDDDMEYAEELGGDEKSEHEKDDFAIDFIEL